MDVQETIGERIARLREAHGWTQQALADRAAVSRVAISHIEMDLSTPSERTITLLSGLFKLEPRDLVANTSYPRAKTERLPFVACCYTTLELQLALLERDMAWLRRLQQSPQWSRLADELLKAWSPQLAAWRREALEQEQQHWIAAARRALREACRQPQSPVVTKGCE